MLRKVHLHGQLGKRFGRCFELDVSSAAEAFRALAFQVPGFSRYVAERKYQISVGEGQVLGAEQLPMRLGSGRDVHITPAGAVAGIETILLIGTLVLTAALSIVTILMMPKVPTPGSREEATKTSSFIFDGAVNVTEQGHCIPLVYGRFRTGSIVGSAGISTTDVTEATVSANPTDPYSGGGGGGEGGVDNYDGYVGASPGIQGGFHGDQWTQLAKGGKAGGSGTSRAAQEDPNTLQSQATAKVLDIVSEGEIVGLVDGLKSVYFDETPLQNTDGSFNFAGVAVEQRVGLPDQDFIPGFSQTETTTAVNTKVSVAIGPVTRTITDEDVTVARVTIRLPQLYQQDTTNGDLKATTVTVAILVQADGGGFTEVARPTFTGKTNSGYQRSIDVRLPNGVEREVRVTRITADSALASLANDTYFDLLTEVVEAKLSYPDTALVGLTVDARQFGSNIPTRSYDIKGIIVEVPTNYDPVTRVYTGVWDGTFKRAWTDNPAWVFRDIIVNRRYGLGTRIGSTIPDKWTLYSIAQYNDELVPDMFGGTQPRYTINCVINSQASAYDVIASIASTFRGWAYWGSGSIMAAQDRPEDPSILVTPSNVEGGVIEYGRATPLERRRSVAVVWWNDPTDGYKLTPEIYERDDLIRRFGRRTGDQVTAFGVSNRGQAHRMARWIMEDEDQASNSTAVYSVGDDHGFVEPGRIAQIADPMYTATRRGGRVVAASANQVTLDANVVIQPGRVYTLKVMLPDGTVRTRTITNGAGSFTVINLGGAAFGTPPNPGSVWTVESDVVANRQFRVRALTCDDPPHKVQAVAHDPTKYDRVEQDRDISAPAFLDLPVGPLEGPPFDSLDVMEFLLLDGTSSIPSVQVSWNASADPRIIFYQVQYQRPGAQWEPLPDGLDTSRVVRGTEAGTWGVRVRGLDSLGNKTVWIQKTFDLDGHVDALPEVDSPALMVNPDAFIAKIIWFKPADTRPLRYEIFHSATNVFGTALSLGVTDQTEYSIALPGYYWVRTVFINAVSAAPVSVHVTTADIGFLPGLGDLATLDTVELGAGGQVVREDGTSHATDANTITALGTAAAITAQGSLATLSGVNLGTNVYRSTGGAALLDADLITLLGTAAAITAQGALATLSQVALGASGRVYRDDGTTRLTDALAITALGTAAAIAGQGTGATANNLTGLNATEGSKLTGIAAGATVGGILGTNVYRSSGPLIVDADAITALGTAAAIAGQGTFATLSAINGTLADSNNLLRRTAGGIFTGELGADVTGAHTAAAFTGQGSLATLNEVTNAYIRAGALSDNLVPNSEMSSTAKWSASGGPIYVTPAGFGAYMPGAGAYYVPPGTSNGLLYANSGNPIPFAGKRLHTSAWCYSTGGEVQVGYFYVLCYRSDTTYIGAYGGQLSVPTTSAWFNVGQWVDLPADTAAVVPLWNVANTMFGNTYMTNLRVAATQPAATVGSIFNTNTYRNDGTTLVNDAAAITSLGTASAIAGQGTFATLSSINSTTANANNLMRYTSGGLFTGELGADVTSTHTASAIVSQGTLATQNAATWSTQVTGTGKPEDYAETTAVVTGLTDLVVPVDSAGTVIGSLSDYIWQFQLIELGAPVASGITWTRTTPSGITTAVSGAGTCTLSVSAFPGDNVEVVLSAARSGKNTRQYKVKFRKQVQPATNGTTLPASQTSGFTSVSSGTTAATSGSVYITTGGSGNAVMSVALTIAPTRAAPAGDWYLRFQVERWNGSSWVTVGSTFDGTVASTHPDGDGIYLIDNTGSVSATITYSPGAGAAVQMRLSAWIISGTSTNTTKVVKISGQIGLTT